MVASLTGFRCFWDFLCHLLLGCSSHCSNGLISRPSPAKSEQNQQFSEVLLFRKDKYIIIDPPFSFAYIIAYWINYKKMPIMKVILFFDNIIKVFSWITKTAMLPNNIQFGLFSYFTLDQSSPHRMKKEPTKMNHPKSPKSAAHHCNQDENKDPQKSAAGEKAPVRPGVSRLPVLAKSLHLPTPSSFSLSNCQWEEKPLAVSVSFSSRFENLD